MTEVLVLYDEWVSNNSILVFLKCTVRHIILPASLVSVTECDNQEKLGSIVNVDFMTINQPCNCEVKPQFSGDLVFASNVVLYDCYTEVTIRRNTQNDDIFAVRCPKTHSSKMYSVSNSSVFEISSTYLRRTGDTSFHQSIQIFQGNYKNNNPQKRDFYVLQDNLVFEYNITSFRICFHLIHIKWNVLKYRPKFFLSLFQYSLFHSIKKLCHRPCASRFFHISIDKSFNEPIAVTCVLNKDQVLPTTPSVQVTSTGK